MTARLYCANRSPCSAERRYHLTASSRLRTTPVRCSTWPPAETARRHPPARRHCESQRRRCRVSGRTPAIEIIPGEDALCLELTRLRSRGVTAHGRALIGFADMLLG